jgi:hypothetical protein
VTHWPNFIVEIGGFGGKIEDRTISSPGEMQSGEPVFYLYKLQVKVIGGCDIIHADSWLLDSSGS